MVTYLRKWGPIKGSWAMWGERLVREVRNSSAVENRSVAALGKGYVRWKATSPTKIRPRPEIVEHGRWWNVDDGRNRIPTKTLTLAEKKDVLTALHIDGQLPADVVPEIPDMQRRNSYVGIFRLGETLKAKSSVFKSIYTTRRSDAVRNKTYVITLYDNGVDVRGVPNPLKPMVAQVLKIVSWKQRPTSVPVYALKVRVLSTTATTIPSILSLNTRAQPRGSPSSGEWVGICNSVARRQPLLLPKALDYSNKNVVLSDHLYSVCMVPAD